MACQKTVLSLSYKPPCKGKCTRPLAAKCCALTLRTRQMRTASSWCHAVMVADNYTRGEQVNASIDGIGLLEGLITKFSSFDYSIRSTSWLVLMQPRNRAGYDPVSEVPTGPTPGAAVKAVMTDDGTLHAKLNLTCTYMQQLQCNSHVDNIYTW